MLDVKALVEQYLGLITDYRRQIHMHPEASHQEQETAAFLAQTLHSIGLSPQTGVGGTGVIALIEGSGPGRCVALRADIDALPISEHTGLSFASKNPGFCHACGHDMHAAMLLGAAHVLYALRGSFCGCVKLIFQPAEEDVTCSGAAAMIRDGVLENPKVEAIFAQHIWPYYPVGSAAIRDGAMMAASDRFTIKIKGKSTHGSAPEDGIDAISVAAQTVCALQTIISRNVSPLDSAVISVGTISGGDRYNIIANEVRMEGTCRTLAPAVRDRMPQMMERVISGVASAMGADATLEYHLGYSPTINHPDMFRLLSGAICDAVGEENLCIPKNSALGGEDFSFYCELIPGAMLWLGARDPEKEFYPLHNGCLSPDERALPIGTEILVRAALDFLKQ